MQPGHRKPQPRGELGLVGGEGHPGDGAEPARALGLRDRLGLLVPGPEAGLSREGDGTFSV